MVGVKLFHDQGAVSCHQKTVDHETKYYLKVTGKDPVLKNFEKWDPQRLDTLYSIIPYTTHKECMVAFGEHFGWINDGKQLRGSVMSITTSQNDFSVVELADGIVVYPTMIPWKSCELQQQLGESAHVPANVLLFAVDVDDVIPSQMDNYDRQLIEVPGGDTTKSRLSQATSVA